MRENFKLEKKMRFPLETHFFVDCRDFFEVKLSGFYDEFCEDLIFIKSSENPELNLTPSEIDEIYETPDLFNINFIESGEILTNCKIFYLESYHSYYMLQKDFDYDDILIQCWKLLETEDLFDSNDYWF